MTFLIHLKWETAFAGLTDSKFASCRGKKMGYLLFEISTGKQNEKTQAPTNSQQFERIISARGQEMFAAAI